ncbi:hypothetical protein TNCV_3227171 [Trichonephila clavipes]|nr:hypothetical protein TNCV_3227171 [Trichonephila clavipes]
MSSRLVPVWPDRAMFHEFYAISLKDPATFNYKYWKYWNKFRRNLFFSENRKKVTLVPKENMELQYVSPLRNDAISLATATNWSLSKPDSPFPPLFHCNGTKKEIAGFFLIPIEA